jgi:hypothetical protein
MEEPSFRPGWHRFRCWRGPSWINTAWLLAPALRRFGYAAEAEQLLGSCVELVERSGFREYYNPLSGEGLAARRFGWSTLLVDALPSVEDAFQAAEPTPYRGSVRAELRAMSGEVAGELRRGLRRRAARARRRLWSRGYP